MKITHYERIKAKDRKAAKMVAAQDWQRSVLAGLREAVEGSEKALPRKNTKEKAPQQSKANP